MMATAEGSAGRRRRVGHGCGQPPERRKQFLVGPLVEPHPARESPWNVVGFPPHRLADLRKRDLDGALVIRPALARYESCGLQPFEQRWKRPVVELQRGG